MKSCASKTTASNSVGKDQWYKHFYNVFNSFFDNESNILDEDEDENVRRSDENDVNESNDSETLEGDITETEVYEVIIMLKNGKAPGPDPIIGEVFKNSATHVVSFLLRYFNKFFSSGLYPNLWSEVIIQPVFKKGDPDIHDSYRGISLLFLSCVFAANYTATF